MRHYTQELFIRKDIIQTKMSERLQPSETKLEQMWFCKEHLSVIARDPLGRLYCYDGGELIESGEQIVEGMGHRVNFTEDDE